MEFAKTEINDTTAFRKAYKRTLRSSVFVIIVSVMVQIVTTWLFFNFGFPVPWLGTLIVGMFCVTFVGSAIFDIFQKLKSSSWLIGISDDSVYIKYRSYRYAHLKINKNPVVIFQPSEIEAFREITITDIIPTGRSKDRIDNYYLEFIVSSGLTSLRESLSYEQRCYGLCRERQSIIEISQIDFPVTVPQDNVVRINISKMTPPKDCLLSELKNMAIKESDVSHYTFNFINLGNRTPDDSLKQRITELLKEGRRLDARNAIEYCYHISRKQTNEMIDTLIKEGQIKGTGAL